MKTGILSSVRKGPWLGGDFLRQMTEGLQHLLQAFQHDLSLLESDLEMICHDLNVPADTYGPDDVLDLYEDKALKSVGMHVAPTRWFGWCFAFEYEIDPCWTRVERILSTIFKALGVFLDKSDGDDYRRNE